MNDPDDLAGELRELYAAERATPAAVHGTRAAVRAKLAATVGVAPLGHAAATIGTAAKVIATVAILGALGGGAVAIVHGRSDAPPSSHSSSERSRDHAIAQPVEPAPSVAPPADPIVSAAAPAPEVAPPARSVPRPKPPPDIASDEPTLLRDAWRALSANAPARALELVEIDQRAHARAPLAEEREALRIIALARLRRAADAHAAEAKFLQEYPDSVHRELVHRAVAEMEEIP